MHSDDYKVIVHVYDVLGLHKAAFTNQNGTKAINTSGVNIEIKTRYQLCPSI